MLYLIKIRLNDCYNRNNQRILYDNCLHKLNYHHIQSQLNNYLINNISVLG